MKQVFNPYLPSYEYIPDGEPRVFDGRLYIYGSHDRFNGEVYCQNDYVIFGAASDGLTVYHSYVLDKKNIGIFRKSKYSQSVIGSAYRDAKIFLEEGKFVLFSGTPCQIAGLRSFLINTNTNKLLTVEVICEGVPSPLYIRKYDSFCQKKSRKPRKKSFFCGKNRKKLALIKTF